MAVLTIIEAPHPVLAMRAREVEADEFGPELARKLSDLAETMYAAAGVGLAAPQVSDPRRFIAIDPGEKEQRGKRLHQMVNPRIAERSEDTIVWRETCLSVPGLEVDVVRSRRIRVEWQSALDGGRHSAWFEEYEAVIVQHELDHLEGTVLLDRVSAFKRGRWVSKRQKQRLKEAVLAD